LDDTACCPFGKQAFLMTCFEPEEGAGGQDNDSTEIKEKGLSHEIDKDR
jgi:hypothetical protein